MKNLAFLISLAFVLVLFQSTDTVALTSSPSAQNKLQVCQKKEAGINDRHAHLEQSYEKHLKVLNKLQDRVEARYKKVSGQGVSVVNYTDLLNQTNSAKLSATTSITNLKQVTFKCSNGSVNDQLSNFKNKSKETNKSLQDYRLAIKKLNIAINNAIPASASGKKK